MNDLEQISELIENIAIVHPSIGHVAGSENHFFKWNFNEVVNGERSDLEFPCIGLSLKDQSGMSGSYAMKGMMMNDTMYVMISVFDIPAGKSATEEETCYQEMKLVMDNIVDWLMRTSLGASRCDWPVLCKLDLNNISYHKIGPIAQTDAVGWVMTLQIVNDIDWDDITNPLITLMTP